jgi:3-mercaptopyruvate sulfurtransferase SseA
MDPTCWLIASALIGAWLLFRAVGLARPDQLRQYRQAGANIIDVRSPEEFQQGHLPEAINLPFASASVMQVSALNGA